MTPPPPTIRRLGNLLIERGYLSLEQLDTALAAPAGNGRRAADGRDPHRPGILHRRSYRRMPGRRLRRALRQIGGPAVRSQGGRRAAAGIHREEPRPAAVQDPPGADDRGFRTVQSVSHRGTAVAHRPRRADRGRHRQRHPADDHQPARFEGLRHRRHHRGLGARRSHAHRRGHRGHRRHRGGGGAVAGHPPGQLHDLHGGQRGGQRHSHRARRTMRSRPQPHRRPPLQGARSAHAPAGGHHQPHQDHGGDGHLRTPPPPGRPRQRDARQPQDRPPREHVPGQPRRKDGHPRARHPQGLAPPPRPRVRGRYLERPGNPHPGPQRDLPGDRDRPGVENQPPSTRRSTKSPPWKTTSAPWRTRSNTTSP